MLTRFFDAITRISVRFRLITFLLSLAVLAAGGYAFTQLNQELLPPVEFPQTIVFAQWADAEDTDQLLELVTMPLEDVLGGVEGVVNVETQTNQSFSVIIARNEFGLDQDEVLADIENAIAATTLPETAEAEIFNFSLSDLPVVIASVSSDEKSLEELKELIETDLVPKLERIENIERVTVDGGQELPEIQIAEVESEEAVSEPEPVEEEMSEDEMARLSPALVAGLALYDIRGITDAREISPRNARILLYQGGELAIEALRLLTPDNLRVGQPETLVYLPTEYIETLDEALIAELDVRSAEFGGTGQFSLADIADAQENNIDVLSGKPLDEAFEIAEVVPTVEPTATLAPTPVPTPTPAPTAEPTAEPEVSGIPLPDSWIGAAAQSGATVATTDDVTPLLVEGIVEFAPQLLADLTPEMLLAMPLDALGALPQQYLTSLDPELQAALFARVQAEGGEVSSAPTTPTDASTDALPPEEAMAMTDPEPFPLVRDFVQLAANNGLEVKTTADVSPFVISRICKMAPDALFILGPVQMSALPTRTLQFLREDYHFALLGWQKELVGNELANRIALAQGIEIPENVPVALPASWIGAAEQSGVTVATTEDITPELVTGISQFAPQLFADLTPDMLLVLPTDALAALPMPYVETVEPAVLAQLLMKALAETSAPAGESADGVPLPDSWIAAASAQGATIATTADAAPQLVEGIAGFAPQLLNDLTPEMLLAMPPESLAVLPPEYVTSLDADLQTAVSAISGVDFSAVQTPAGESPDREVNVVPLPQSWIDAAEAQGATVATTADAIPPLVEGIAEFAPVLLEDLTPDMLLGMPTASLAVLPYGYVNSLEPDLRDEIIEIAGLDAEAVLSAEPPAPADPTELNPVFATVGEQIGQELTTIDDIDASFIRVLAGFGEQGEQLLALFTPGNLRLLDPEAVGVLPMPFVENLDADLRTYLDGRAVEYGGAGQLAIAEAEAAAALGADAPPLSGPWIVPDEEGNESEFQTAANLIVNSFPPPTAADLLNGLDQSPFVEDLRDWIGVLDADVVAFVVENEPDFIERFETPKLKLLPPDSLSYLLDTYPDSFDGELTAELEDIAAGDVEVFVPETTITRQDGNPSLVLSIYKTGGSNTVNVADDVFQVLDNFAVTSGDLSYNRAFEQATFIRESIDGVTREGVLGAIFAVLVILIFLSGRINGRYRLSWRATLITALSIPSSILFAFLLMYFLPRTVGLWLENLAATSDATWIGWMTKLFPENITLNIMTLSGLTVAIGRVVDDSIVVLENSYRYIQKGDDPLQAVLQGTREVAVAIFSATVTTMAVFLPIGFVGGVISEFFLPFGLTVTYALIASYIVSITVVPALTFLFIRKKNIPEERETFLQRGYTPVLEWTLAHRWLTMLFSALIFAGSVFLLGQLPNSFIPGLGEPAVAVTIGMPAGMEIADTNELVEEFEAIVLENREVRDVLTTVGGSGGQEALFGGGGVAQNAANLQINVKELEIIDDVADELRVDAERIFGEENVTVSAAIQAGFSGFAIIVTGDDLQEIVDSAPEVEAALAALDADEDGLPDMLNIGSNAEAALDGSTVIRIDGKPAISFTAELKTADTLGVTEAAKEAVAAVVPATLEVTEGFDSQQQAEGFTSLASAIFVSIGIVYLIIALTFRSLIHPLTILFTLPFALVGAAIALFITNSVFGISAMMGMLMLVGIVVTNGIVLLELVQQLREKGIPTYESLVEAGRTRIRPIWMTALTAILALIPLAISTEGGAIIAAELGTAVIGGLTVSTALTLIVIPVVYSLFDQFTSRFDKRRYEQLHKRYGNPAAGD